MAISAAVVPLHSGEDTLGGAGGVNVGGGGGANVGGAGDLTVVALVMLTWRCFVATGGVYDTLAADSALVGFAFVG